MNRFPWRFLLYAVFLAYLLLDLKACNGPLKRSITSRHDKMVEAAITHKWVAIVNQEPLSREQLDLAVYRHLFQRGKQDEEIPEKNLKMIRRAVLQSLINDTLVRQYADGEGYAAPEEEVESFLSSWSSQFQSGEEFAERANAQGLTEAELREEMARIWSRKRWLEQRIAPGIDVTDEEVKTWFEANREEGEGFVEPEKIRARHIFLSTVEIDDETREMMIRDIHRQLLEGTSSFEELAEAFSDDPKTKKLGGDLNWFSRNRVPADFAEVVFSQEPGKLGEPFRTSIGWHIVEVLDHQEERPASFDEVRTEIRHHLENQRTEDTIKRLMKKLRTVAHIRLFPEHI